MKIATKTLASLLLIAMLTLSSVNLAAATSGDGLAKTSERKLERVYKRHDRKMELRASVLGITSDQLKEELKSKSFESVLKAHGFKDVSAFNTALTGKLKEELKKRGWSDEKIAHHFQKKLERTAAQD